jgi:hypothetical protein
LAHPHVDLVAVALFQAHADAVAAEVPIHAAPARATRAGRRGGFGVHFVPNTVLVAGLLRLARKGPIESALAEVRTWRPALRSKR